MAISVGDAVLKLGVDTKDLDKGMKGLGARIKKHQKAIGIGMVAMGGAILAAGLMSVKSFAKMGDEVQKMALRTGFATEALSEYRHALEISGASLETLEKAVKRMSKTIVDASEGMATYIRAFERIGIEVDDLMGLKPEEQFDKIAMAIAAIEDPTIRAATAQDIFGRAGTQLLPLLAQGAEGMAALREEAHKLGIVFDQEAANAAAEFNDALKRLSESITGIKNQIGAALVPTLTSLADSVTETTKGFIEWIKTNQDLFNTLTGLTVKLGLTLVAMGGLILALPKLIALAGWLHVALWALIPIFAAIVAGLAAIFWGISELTKASTLQKKVTEDLRKIEIEYIKMLAGKENEYNKLILAYAEDIKMREAMGRAAESEIQWLEQNTEALKSLREEQTLQSEVTIPEVLEGTTALIQANMALAGSYGTVAGMARSAWEEMSRGARAAGLAGYYKEMGYSALERKAIEKYGEWFGRQPFGALERLPPSLYRPGTFTPGELRKQIYVSVYLDGEEIGGNVIQKVTEKVGLQGGL